MADALSGQGIDLVDGVGPSVFVDPQTVTTADGREFRGDAVVVAVGGRAGRPPIPGVELALTYEDLHNLTALPTSAAIVGGADTGCQIASILADFGVDVTFIEGSPSLVPRADPDVCRCARGVLPRSRHHRAHLDADRTPRTHRRRRGRRLPIRHRGRSARCRCGVPGGRLARQRGPARGRRGRHRNRRRLRQRRPSAQGAACRTSSRPGMSTGSACSCPAPASPAASPPRTRCSAPGARSATRWSPPGASPIPSTARSD